MKIADIEVTLIDHMGSDLSVVNAARVSFNKESEFEIHVATGEDEHGYFEEEIKILSDKDVKLINYLATHKHFSPFNHAFLSFRCKAPLSAARQLVKHEYMPWNEVSRRYVDDEPEFYFPEFYRKRAENIKQGSSEEDSGYTLEEAMEDTADALEAYQRRLYRGVCPEQARDVLPLNTMTEYYWSGTLGAVLKMLSLRLDPHTQKESRIVAQHIAKHVQELFPVSYKARIN